MDIYGRSAAGYIGIQCKGKDDYSKQQLTEKEIDAEIAKAALFQPPLAKFYFATTANRSVTIDAYIRAWDEKHRQRGKFEIHVFFWEDIADLIDEHQATFNWYVKGQGFRLVADAALVFDNGQESLRLQPSFTKRTKRYGNVETLRLLDYKEMIEGLNQYRPFMMPKVKIKTFEDYVAFINQEFPETSPDNDPQPVEHFLSNGVRESQRSNLSVNTIRLKLLNTGSIPLEDFKVYLEFENVVSCDKVSKRQRFFDTYSHAYQVLFYQDEPFKAVFNPSSKVLVEGDAILLDKLCFRTLPADTDVVLHWKLVSRGFRTSGKLTIQVRPLIEEFDYIHWVSGAEGRQSKVVYTDNYQY